MLLMMMMMMMMMMLWSSGRVSRKKLAEEKHCLVLAARRLHLFLSQVHMKFRNNGLQFFVFFVGCGFGAAVKNIWCNWVSKIRPYVFCLYVSTVETS